MNYPRQYFSKGRWDPCCGNSFFEVEIIFEMKESDVHRAMTVRPFGLLHPSLPWRREFGKQGALRRDPYISGSRHQCSVGGEKVMEAQN
jgi:hypothetical protein